MNITVCQPDLKIPWYIASGLMHYEYNLDPGHVEDHEGPWPHRHIRSLRHQIVCHTSKCHVHTLYGPQWALHVACHLRTECLA